MKVKTETELYSVKLRRHGITGSLHKNLQKYASVQSWWENNTRGDELLQLLGRLSGSMGTGKRKRYVKLLYTYLQVLFPTRKWPLEVAKLIRTFEAWLVGSLAHGKLKSIFYVTTVHCQYGTSRCRGLIRYVLLVVETVFVKLCVVEMAAYALTSQRHISKTIRHLKCADVVREHYPLAPTIH